MGNKNDKVVGYKNASNKGKTEKESINLTIASHIATIGSFVLQIISIFFGKIKLSTFYSILIIVWFIFFVMLIINFIKKTKDYLNICKIEFGCFRDCYSIFIIYDI